jgi:hypothetical protein
MSTEAIVLLCVLAMVIAAVVKVVSIIGFAA